MFTPVSGMAEVAQGNWYPAAEQSGPESEIQF